jgi:hypothetical protein
MEVTMANFVFVPRNRTGEAYCERHGSGWRGQLIGFPVQGISYRDGDKLHVTVDAWSETVRLTLPWEGEGKALDRLILEMRRQAAEFLGNEVLRANPLYVHASETEGVFIVRETESLFA